MSTSTIALQEPRTALLSRLCDYVELTKPRIAVLELVVVLTAGVVATWGQPSPQLLLHAMLGTLLVAASASALNQWLERREDARMPRTAERPLACGRLTSLESLVFAAVCLLAGAAELALFTNFSAAAWALLTWVLYVLAYTPLKQISSVNTAVGAVAGALPVLIGWTAVGGQLDWRAMALFLVLFLWQFPHFMAIAWLYRRDYANAGYQMLTVVDPTGARAGRQAVVAALALIPISILPVLAAPGLGSLLYAALATLLGFCYLLVSAAFWNRPTDTTARLLLKTSLVYLPTVLITLMLAPWI
jgi:protoheme IX farnesyltransferase